VNAPSGIDRMDVLLFCSEVLGSGLRRSASIEEERKTADRETKT